MSVSIEVFSLRAAVERVRIAGFGDIGVGLRHGGSGRRLRQCRLRSDGAGESHERGGKTFKHVRCPLFGRILAPI